MNYSKVNDYVKYKGQNRNHIDHDVFGHKEKNEQPNSQNSVSNRYNKKNESQEFMKIKEIPAENSTNEMNVYRPPHMSSQIGFGVQNKKLNMNASFDENMTRSGKKGQNFGIDSAFGKIKYDINTSQDPEVSNP